jgi:LPS-assembly protein
LVGRAGIRRLANSANPRTSCSNFSILTRVAILSDSEKRTRNSRATRNPAAGAHDATPLRVLDGPRGEPVNPAWQALQVLFSSAHRMRCRSAIVLLALALLTFVRPALSQQMPESEWTIEPLSKESGGIVEYDWKDGIATGTGGVLVKYEGAVLTAQKVVVHLESGEVVADGDVHIQGEQSWASQHIAYNFKTHQIEAKQFRTGNSPIFAEGKGLYGDVTNRVYVSTNAMMTTDDVSQPLTKIRAKKLIIVPGKRLQAYHATLYVGDVPVFYFPYYARNLGPHANNFNFTPGYRSLYGPFILGNYTWWYDEQLDGKFHVDYRGKRGPGLGPDVNYNFGKWGEGTVKYYYTHDQDSNIDELGVPIPENRQRVWFSYQSNPETNLYLKAMVRWESDLAVNRDFFEGEYVNNPQPSTYFDANKLWQNYSLDTYVQPRVNDWLQTVERLPDVRLTGYRQQLGVSPLYYESETSAGYYKFAYAQNAGINGPPPGLDYEAGRADTFHQVLLPETAFGWLNVTPRVGGRLTAYSDASGPGATTEERSRAVFNTGTEVSFKASQLWPNIENDFFQVDGIRHIVEPSVNYTYVPNPSVAPDQLPQFDSELPSLRLLPIEYPDYNSIDSIDSQNVIRWKLRNKLQTKRDDKVVNLINWDVYTDWLLNPNSSQTTFTDLYSDLGFRPRSWLTIESLVRYEINGDALRMSYTTITIQPTSAFSWKFGQYYLRNDISSSPTALGEGNNAFTSVIAYRLSENYGIRMGQYYEATTGKLLNQTYTFYRDMRSWTAALSLVFRNNSSGPQDYGFAFSFSLKAYPQFGVSSDSPGPYAMLGL